MVNSIRLSADTIRKLVSAIRLSTDSLIVMADKCTAISSVTHSLSLSCYLVWVLIGFVDSKNKNTIYKICVVTEVMDKTFAPDVVFVSFLSE